MDSPTTTSGNQRADSEPAEEALGRPDPTAMEQAERVASWVYSPIGRAIAPIRGWWQRDVRDSIDQQAVIAKIASESPATPRYIFMTTMSAGIAILGLLLSSPAVVIGAMLLSPLMNPILGVGFALASGKQKWLRISAKSLAIGSIVAVGFSALIVLVSPLQTVTEEIASRTRPNIFDLMVALFSSLAGSYAMIRGREGTIVGVAIATALMPPLAVVGFGLATLNWTVFGGALALYVTNFLTIALTATVMARLYGFRTTLSSRQGWFQSIGIFVVFVALAIPLFLSLRQIVTETNGTRIARTAITAAFPPKARISSLEIDWDSSPVGITATVLTPEFRSGANASVTAEVERQLGENANVSIDQFRVGANPGAAEQAELARARAAEQEAATERQIATMTSELALVAGVGKEDVTIDRSNRRAMVTARPLDGLTLSGYRALEQRISASVAGWSVQLRPPLVALPDIPVEDGKVPDSATDQLHLLEWAARRTGTPVSLAGPEAPVAALAERLRSRGSIVVIEPDGPSNRIVTSWTVAE